MKTVILSGGEFGGLEIELPLEQMVIEMVCENGEINVYECRKDQAIFIEVK